MQEYTRKDLDREAREVVAEIRRETGKAARMVSWKLLIGGSGISLAVVVQAYDGLRQRNKAI